MVRVLCVVYGQTNTLLLNTEEGDRRGREREIREERGGVARDR